MEKFEVPIMELLEWKSALVVMAENAKIPIIYSMSFSEIKREIEGHIKDYQDSNEKIILRLAEKAIDADGNKVDSILPEKELELSQEKKSLLDKIVEVKVPTFTIEELGYDSKKPATNKYEITPGAIMGLGRLVKRGKKK